MSTKTFGSRMLAGEKIRRFRRFRPDVLDLSVQNTRASAFESTNWAKFAVHLEQMYRLASDCERKHLRRDVAEAKILTKADPADIAPKNSLVRK
jgi:hypothetical protein